MAGIFKKDVPESYTGALTFWLYILAALTLTTLILTSLYQRTKKPSPQIYLFSACALTSFTTLSYTMLSVLISSYKTWSTQHTIPNSSTLHLWQWSLTTPLFTDFANAVFADPPRRLWTNLELIVTGYLASYMGYQGMNASSPVIRPLQCTQIRASNTTLSPPSLSVPLNPPSSSTGRKQKIPHLWAYFLLLEILPSSFTQNLFYLALLTHPPSSNQPKQLEPPQNTKTATTIAGLSYLLLLGVGMPRLAQTSYLMPAVLILRALLLLPLFVPAETGTDRRTESEKHAERGRPWTNTVSIILSGAAALVLASGGGSTPRGLAAALGSHPAVSALGWDFLIGVGSWGVWMARGWLV